MQRDQLTLLGLDMASGEMIPGLVHLIIQTRESIELVVMGLLIIVYTVDPRTGEVTKSQDQELIPPNILDQQLNVRHPPTASVWGIEEEERTIFPVQIIIAYQPN